MFLTNDSNIHVHKKYIRVHYLGQGHHHSCALIIIILDLLIVTTITIDIKLLWPSWSCFYFIYLDHRRRHLGSHGHHCVPFDAQGLSKGNPSLRTAQDHFFFLMICPNPTISWFIIKKKNLLFRWNMLNQNIVRDNIYQATLGLSIKCTQLRSVF